MKLEKIHKYLDYKGNDIMNKVLKQDLDEIVRGNFIIKEFDKQNILHISKLFNITTDYLLNDDYDSDRDIPVVKTVTKETENLISKKKQTHLIVAICFIVAAICLVIGIVNRTNGIQLVMFVYALFFCIGNAVIPFVLFFMKR